MDSIISAFSSRVRKSLQHELSDLHEDLTHQPFSNQCSHRHEKERAEILRLGQENGKMQTGHSDIVQFAPFFIVSSSECNIFIFFCSFQPIYRLETICCKISCSKCYNHKRKNRQKSLFFFIQSRKKKHQIEFTRKSCSLSISNMVITITQSITSFKPSMGQHLFSSTTVRSL